MKPFSVMCAGGCGHPLLAAQATSDLSGWMAEAVAITPAGTLIAGPYGEDGSIAGDGQAVAAGATAWHRACWETSGKPLEYRGPCVSARDQGWFFLPGAHDRPDPRRARPDPAGSQGTAERRQATGRGRVVTVEAPGGIRFSCPVGGDGTLTVLVDDEPVLGVDEHGAGHWHDDEWHRLPAAGHSTGPVPGTDPPGAALRRPAATDDAARAGSIPLTGSEAARRRAGPQGSAPEIS